ncbi:MAG: hypothetical protein ABL936_18455, partial [Aestuariivirga sp.]
MTEPTQEPQLQSTPEARGNTFLSWLQKFWGSNVWQSVPQWGKAIAFILLLLALAWTTRAWDVAKTAAARMWWKISPPVSAIYVESPEVYTRERLINERSAEEAWLNDQLRRIDGYTSKANIINRVLDDMDLVISAAEGSPPSVTPGQDKTVQDASDGKEKSQSGTDPLTLTFDQDFKLRSAYRNLVRQRMIENRLDDRHDLEGNALYILKFDSTVLGIPAANDRALVRVRILPPTELIALTAPDAKSVLASIDSTPAVFSYVKGNYSRWLRSLELRMNMTLSAYVKEFRDSGFKEDYVKRRTIIDQLNRNINAVELHDYKLEDVLTELSKGQSFPDKNVASLIVSELYFYFAKLAVASVTGDALIDVDINKLPIVDKIYYGTFESPLSRDLFSLWAKFTPDISMDPRIQIGPLVSNVIVTNKNCIPAKKNDLPDYFSEEFVGQPAVLADQPAVLVGQPAVLWQHFQYQIPADYEMRSAIISGILEQINKNSMPTIFNISDREGSNCEIDVGVTVESGLINFSRKIGKYNTYSYSVLPRESPVSVYSEIATTTKAMTSLAGAQAGRTMRRTNSNWELRPVLTTFGDTVRVETNSAAGNIHERSGKEAASSKPLPSETEPVVGWVIDLNAQAADASRLTRPVTVNESVVAIVSVPAWWSELVVTIDRGWLTEEILKDGSPDDGSRITYSVMLPSRSELLDTLLFGTVGRQPLITGVDAASSETYNNCEETSVLVSGPRLWRNTAVTIGSTKADEVEVLPNMEGISAKFRNKSQKTAEPAVKPDPPAATGDSQDTITGTLRVWTSDG